MELFERIKIIRGFLKQEEFASKLGVSKVTVGRWERGERVPDAQDLYKITVVFPEFNPTWILTGEGEMKKISIFSPTPKPGGSSAEKFKLIRGNLSYREFAQKFVKNENDIEKWASEFEAIEEGSIEPDLTLISCICHYCGVSPSWMIEDEGPMLKKDVFFEGQTKELFKINEGVLTEILEEAEVYESLNPGTLLPWKKAQLIAELYQMRMEKLNKKNEDAD